MLVKWTSIPSALEPGLPYRNSTISRNGERVLKSKETGIAVQPGDRIICLSSGVGGFGDSAERTKPSRAWDEKIGYVE